jgi:YaiO family outer membrane protein
VKRCAALAAGLLALAVQAQQAPVNRLQLSVGHDSLNNGYRDWDEVQLRYSRQWERHELAEVAITQAHRFGDTDSQVEANYVRPLTPKLTASAQLSFSPSPHFLANRAIGAGVQYEFLPAWLLHAGLRHTSYPNASVNQATLMLERYAGNESVSLAWRPVSALGTQASGFELRGNHYYGDDSYLGLIASSGREATQLGDGGIALAAVRSLALVGRHRLAPAWSATYALSRTRQGSFYSRTGFSAGVQNNF